MICSKVKLTRTLLRFEMDGVGPGTWVRFDPLVENKWFWLWKNYVANVLVMLPMAVWLFLHWNHKERIIEKNYSPSTVTCDWGTYEVIKCLLRSESGVRWMLRVSCLPPAKGFLFLSQLLVVIGPWAQGHWLWLEVARDSAENGEIVSQFIFI
jgi:hypothetical protein